MFNWNAQNEVDTVNETAVAPAPSGAQEQTETSHDTNNTRFPCVDHILNDISSDWDKRTFAA